MPIHVHRWGCLAYHIWPVLLTAEEHSFREHHVHLELDNNDYGMRNKRLEDDNDGSSVLCEPEASLRHCKARMATINHRSNREQ